MGVGGVDCRVLEYRILPKKPEGGGLEELAKSARAAEAIEKE